MRALRTARPAKPIAAVRYTDTELVTQIADGSESALRELMRRWEVKLYVFAAWYIGTGPDTEEVVQETFIRVYQHAKKFQVRKKFSTWLFTIAHRLCLNVLRNTKRRCVVCYADLTPAEWTRLAKRKRDQEDDANILDFLDPKQDQDKILERIDFEQKVADAIAALSANHREAFDLRMFRGKTYQEIAKIVGIDIGTVKSRIHRAKTDLRSRLDKSHFD